MNTTHLTLTALAFAALSALTPTRADAEVLDGLNSSIEVMIVGVALGELLIPDLKLEYGDPDVDPNLVLGWPLAVSPLSLEPVHDVAVGLTLIGEPQYKPATGEARGLLLARASARHMQSGAMGDDPYSAAGPGVFAEYGGVLSTRGEGQVIGGGVFYGNSFMAVALGTRWLDQGEGRQTQTVGIDLHLAFSPVLLR